MNIPLQPCELARSETQVYLPALDHGSDLMSISHTTQ